MSAIEEVTPQALDEWQGNITAEEQKLAQLDDELLKASTNAELGDPDAKRRRAALVKARQASRTRIDNLRIAIKGGEERLRAQDAARIEAERAEAAEEAEAIGEEMRGAAANVDAALAQLEGSWGEYADAHLRQYSARRRAGLPVSNQRLAYHLEMALLHTCPKVSVVIGVNRRLRMHAKSLEEQVS